MECLPLLPLRRLTGTCSPRAAASGHPAEPQTADTPPLGLQDAEKSACSTPTGTILQARAAAGPAPASHRRRPITHRHRLGHQHQPDPQRQRRLLGSPVDNVPGGPMIEQGDKRDLRLAAADRNLAATGARPRQHHPPGPHGSGQCLGRPARRPEIRRIADRTPPSPAAPPKPPNCGRQAIWPGGCGRFAADAARVANDAEAGIRSCPAHTHCPGLLLGNRVPANPSLGPPTTGPATRAVAPPRPTPDGRTSSPPASAWLAGALRELPRAQRPATSRSACSTTYPPDGRKQPTASASQFPLFLGCDYRGDIARAEADYTAAERRPTTRQSVVASEQAACAGRLRRRPRAATRMRDVVLPAGRAGRPPRRRHHPERRRHDLTDYLDTQRNLRAAYGSDPGLGRPRPRRLMLRLAGATP